MGWLLALLLGAVAVTVLVLAAIGVVVVQHRRGRWRRDT
jgi:hypothetical protein